MGDSSERSQGLAVAGSAPAAAEVSLEVAQSEGAADLAEVFCGIAVCFADGTSVQAARACIDVLRGAGVEHRRRLDASVTHLVCERECWARYEARVGKLASPVECVTPLWLLRSAQVGRLEPCWAYSPRPEHPLSGLRVCVPGEGGDGVEGSADGVVEHALRSRGAQTSRALHRLCTHVLLPFAGGALDQHAAASRRAAEADVLRDLSIHRLTYGEPAAGAGKLWLPDPPAGQGHQPVRCQVGGIRSVGPAWLRAALRGPARPPDGAFPPPPAAEGPPAPPQDGARLLEGMAPARAAVAAARRQRSALLDLWSRRWCADGRGASGGAAPLLKGAVVSVQRGAPDAICAAAKACVELLGGAFAGDAAAAAAPAGARRIVLFPGPFVREARCGKRRRGRPEGGAAVERLSTLWLFEIFEAERVAALSRERLGALQAQLREAGGALEAWLPAPGLLPLYIGAPSAARPLSGLRIALAGADLRGAAPLRCHLASAIDALGAYHMPAFCAAHCTHLAARDGAAAGEALRGGGDCAAAEVVTFQWLLDCVAQWRRLPERSYRLPGAAAAGGAQGGVGNGASGAAHGTRAVLRTVQSNRPVESAEAGEGTEPSAVCNEHAPGRKGEKTAGDGGGGGVRGGSGSGEVGSSSSNDNKKDTESTDRNSNSNESDNEDRRDADGQRRFLISGFKAKDPSMEASLKAAISRLGGSVCDSAAACTHLVMRELKKTEKFLHVAVQAGKWVLTHDYVLESLAAGRWLPEGRFDWAASAAAGNGIAPAALRRWKARGAFEGSRAVVELPQGHKPSGAMITEMLRLGGAEVVGAEAAGEGTLFVAARGGVDEALRRRGVRFVNANFVIAFATDADVPSPLDAAFAL